MTTTAPDSAAPLRRNRDFQLLMVGNTLNGIGSRMSGLAFPLLTLWLTHSPVLVGVVGASVVGGMVLMGIPAGALVDRWNRKTTMIWSALVAAASYGTVVLAYDAGHLFVIHLVVAGVIVGAAEAIFGPADTAATKSVVPPADLATAMSAVQGRQGVTGLVGPPLGGVLFAISRALPILADVASYVLAAIAAALIRTPLPATHEGEHAEPMMSAMRAGFRHVWRNEVLRPTVVIASGLNFAANGFMIVLIIVLQRRHVAPGLIGGTETAMAVAMIVGSILSGWLLRRMRAGLVSLLGMTVLGLGLTAVAGVHSLVLIMLVLGLTWLMLPAVNAGFLTYVMLITPDSMQGRVQSALMTMVMSTTPLAPVAGGALVQLIGGEATMAVFGGLVLACALLALTVRPLREMPLLSEVTPAGAAVEPALP
ncbi:MFS transporter [Rudaeicoccus suwonensis]|uniref:Putative MFS family arabinose efflux permease n=1 Tax=Rudaeicoccus suwonensis TaxID=657409 RepID=A0A561E8Z6_9MICO|nr:MFS transporter [Rudaeicoccus suwonensis]TWE12079.1 putative MFS family arabinose efflux permease [Rudaeicoccus suwonensis]